MTENRNVMTDDAARAYVVAAAAAVLAGKPQPPLPEGVTHVPVDALASGIAQVVKDLESELAGLSARMSDDPARQAEIRAGLNAVLADIGAGSSRIVETLRAKRD